MTLNYERSYDDSLRKNTGKLVISKYYKRCASAQKGLIMSAHTAYMIILFVCFNVGFLLNIVLRANAQTIIFHALSCAASVVIAGYMPEWMLWASCGLMVASLIISSFMFYKLDLPAQYKKYHS